MWSCRNWKWLRPLGPLTVTTLAISLVWGFNLAADDIKIVGHVKGGLPDVSIGRWTQPIADLADMTTTAALVTIVSCAAPTLRSSGTHCNFHLERHGADHLTLSEGRRDVMGEGGVHVAHDAALCSRKN